ncbi:CoA transferase subunit A [Desulfovibrio sp. OttesenSCG-928-O18]|nr:CoA transferase subunit A [Desulfovibrio sp. OttesenSCG-928-O18]
MSKRITAAEAAALVPDGASVMVGGFMGCGNPHAILDELLAKGTKDMALICNDCAFPTYGVGKLVVEKRFNRLFATHIGLNPAAGQQMNEGTLKTELIPQGTFAERIRSGGAGIGGFLTPTGVGTPVEEGKQKMTIDGKTYLLEMPLKADIALLKAWKADEAGNLIYRRSTRNFNPLMATAATLVIAEVEEIVPVGGLDPDQIHTPAIFVDKIVLAEKR